MRHHAGAGGGEPRDLPCVKATPLQARPVRKLTSLDSGRRALVAFTARIPQKKTRFHIAEPAVRTKKRTWRGGAMRKNAIALAVGALCVAPAAQAQMVFGNDTIGTMQI